MKWPDNPLPYTRLFRWRAGAADTLSGPQWEEVCDSSAEDPLRPKLALTDLADGNQLPPHRRVSLRFRQGSVAPTDDDGVAHPDPVRLIVRQGEMRQVRECFRCIDQEGIDRKSTRLNSSH